MKFCYFLKKYFLFDEIKTFVIHYLMFVKLSMTDKRDTNNQSQHLLAKFYCMLVAILKAENFDNSMSGPLVVLT